MTVAHILGVMRRLPGYVAIRRALLPRVRKSPTVRAIVSRIYPAEAATPISVTQGRVIAGEGSELLPVVLIVMVGLPDRTVIDVVDEVASVQLLSAGFRVVLVSDGPILAASQRYGYPAELLTPERGWNDHGDGSWADHVGQRVALALTTYQAALVIRVTEDGLDSIAKAMLESSAVAR